jgi:hypothetical protein
MTFRKFSEFLRLSVGVLLLCGACPALRGQALLTSSSPVPVAPTPFVEASTSAPPLVSPGFVGGEHRFWDKQNRALFVTAAVLNGADFAVTRANLQSGGQELNPLVRVFGRSTAGLAVNFVGETVGVISLSYFFHKTGHHKLERAVSLFNIGSSAGAVGYGLAHR